MQHTIRLAIALNARLDDDDGQPLRLWIMPVLIVALWLPALAVRAADTLRTEASDWVWHCRATAIVLAVWLGLLPRWRAVELWSGQ